MLLTDFFPDLINISLQNVIKLENVRNLITTQSIDLYNKAAVNVKVSGL